MGATRTSNAREIDSMCEVIEKDLSNRVRVGGGMVHRQWSAS